MLSLVLRHKPEVLGITLDDNGWTDVSVLLEKLSDQLVTKEMLVEIVEENNKQRFTFNDDCSKIRANQGHTIKVDLELTPAAPTDILYHGTTTESLKSIMNMGLKKMERQHVHLSKDKETAEIVANRRKKHTTILGVDAKAMYDDGYIFFMSKNGVWLTDNVPAKYITLKIA